MADVNRKRGWSAAVLFALAVFSGCSFLKIWSAWYFSSDVGLRFPATFWTMLRAAPRVADEVGVRSLVVTYYGPEMVKLTALLGACLGVGRWVARRPGQRAKSDATPDPAA
jgi:hypothetical protein